MTREAPIPDAKSRTPGSSTWLWQFVLLLVSAIAVFAAVKLFRAPATAPSESTAATPKPSGPAPEGMVWIPGGEFDMGSNDPRKCVCGGPDAMNDARPIHRVYVDGFWMDSTEVTNQQFAAFVDATGYV